MASVSPCTKTAVAVTQGDEGLEPLREHAMAEYEADRSEVVKALLSAAVPGNGTVGALMAFGSDEATNAAAAAAGALDAGAIVSQDPRELVAAAALAYAKADEARKVASELDAAAVYEGDPSAVVAGRDRNAPVALPRRR